MTAVAAGRAGARAASIYVWIGWGAIAAAFLGFAPTYWVPMAAGKFQANPVVHIHGLIFFAWTIFFLVQASLAKSNLARHRAVGVAGVSLATAMTFMGVLVALNSGKFAESVGALVPASKFLFVPLSGILTFAVLFAAAVANVRRPEAHKRLMVLATVATLDAPLARPFLAWVFTGLPPGPPPVWATIPGTLCADLFILAAMAFDWRTRGRPHPVYLIGLPVLLVLQLLRLPISESQAWIDIAGAFLKLAGGLPATPA